MTALGRPMVWVMATGAVLLPVTVAAIGPIDATALAAQERGGAVFAEHCARCHGARADGDSRLATVLKPPPANLRASEMSAADQERMVRLGGEAAFGRSPTMPAWSPTLDDAQIRDVVAYIRSLRLTSSIATMR